MIAGLVMTGWLLVALALVGAVALAGEVAADRRARCEISARAAWEHTRAEGPGAVQPPPAGGPRPRAAGGPLPLAARAPTTTWAGAPA